ncbi:1-acyl-sn-glycerol-3-phosphate acyltransferases [Belliella buryatensis]|uniref:1-acyl-sn-glycerol-3-phosphate acyltransferases n=1 Tax=Belliella buryatensis TaxID=1500549 RepID=A0A239ERW9_9BACT|nr:1-acyl-sn-glycerol-3-phosphate acyltransferase [Belliella buryatensis]SNS46614.1 1-acyl-sn-glycerol-3-phosphate acyltransferases [Belliella buryatensis]
MKNFFNYCLRLIVKLALNLYYGKIIVEGKQFIPKDKAVLIVCNHQNALIDPILIATNTNLKPHFLTRASVFRQSFIAKLLNYIRMIPIYRVRDGVKNMEKNQETFDKSVDVLLNKGAMLIFGEGSHCTLRNLRPLKKGFARIAYQALEKNPELDLVILPVAINFGNHMHSGSRVRITFGETLNPKIYFSNFDALIKATYTALDQLVVTIPEANYDADLADLIAHDIDLTSKVKVEQFLSDRSTFERKNKSPYLRNKVMKLFHFPLYWVWLIMEPKIQDPAFKATFKFVIGLVGVPIWYLILYLGLSAVGHQDWAISFLFLAVIFLLGNRNGQK